MTEQAIETAAVPIVEGRSEEGITVGLVDAIIGIIRVLAPRDMTPGSVQEALADLFEDPDWLIVHASLGGREKTEARS